MTSLFDVTGSFHSLRIGVESPKRGTSFGIGQTIGTRTVEFLFRWNTRYGRYSVTMGDRNGEFFQFYPRVGMEKMLRNFDPGNPPARDLLIGVAASNPSEKVITPTNLGDTHGIFLLTGRIVR